MDLTEYTEMLRRELGSVTRFGGEEFTRTAEMLADALDSSVRLTLLEALSAAAAEITTRLDGTVIDVRLSGPLKARVDAEAAAAGLSVNAWLVRAISRALDAGPAGPQRTQRGPRTGTRFTGYARG